MWKYQELKIAKAILEKLDDLHYHVSRLVMKLQQFKKWDIGARMNKVIHEANKMYQNKCIIEFQ